MFQVFNYIFTNGKCPGSHIVVFYSTCAFIQALLCIIFLILYYSFTYHIDLPIEMCNNVIHVRIMRKSYQCVIQDFEEIIVAQGNVSQNFSFRYLHLHGMQYKCVHLDMRYM